MRGAPSSDSRDTVHFLPAEGSKTPKWGGREGGCSGPVEQRSMARAASVSLMWQLGAHSCAASDTQPCRCKAQREAGLMSTVTDLSCCWFQCLSWYWRLPTSVDWNQILLSYKWQRRLKEINGPHPWSQWRFYLWLHREKAQTEQNYFRFVKITVQNQVLT